MNDNMAYIPGDNNVICDICGRKRKKSETGMSYGTGDLPVFVACLDGCVDQRHPLNSPPPVFLDPIPVKDPRPDTLVNIYPLDSGTTWGNFYGQRWGNFSTGYGPWGKFQTL